ncbi:MAG: hypothetical protein LBK58_13050 [Prevotellaceae bacterium]|jgi:hypothetical protein|nr:hypothetical protein [Prevotellaceae bacterium]
MSAAEILDTAVTSSDTAAYSRIRQAMSNRKLTKRVFSLLTRRPNTATVVPAQETSIDEQFIPYRGMTIRDIRVVVLPPVEYDVRKFDSVPEMNRLKKAINSTHANTRRWVLKNSLLFDKGQEIDPLIMAETESFIRNIGYVNDVYIQIDTVSQTEANVTVIVQDNLSMGAHVHNVSSEVDIEIYDRNFIGLGNNFSLRGIFNAKTDRKFGGGLGYRYPNLLRTFINIDASFVDDILSTYHAVSLERPLQKNLNLFGQLSRSLMEVNLSHTAWDSVSPTYNNDFSVSLGYAFNPTENDNTFVISSRFRDRNPLYRGVDKPDNPESFQYVRNRMTLMQLSVFRQRYFRTSLVNSFGKPENFAYGYNVSAQLGYSEWTQFSKRSIYTSLKVALNKRLPLASVYFEGAVSSFFDREKPFEGILKLKLNMFSSLYSIGNQSYRHFLNIDYTKRLNFIPGFRNYNISFEKLASMKFRDITDYMATEALMFKTEGNVFSSLNVLGFRFLFYSFADFGWVTRYHQSLLNKNNIYWGAGLGVRIRNDLLVFRTLELKIGYYPKMNQHGFNNFVNVGSSIPNVSPNFVPKYPEEIELQ